MPKGVHQLIERAIQRGAEDDLQEGLREHTELREGGALLQVSDEQGNWIYRSPVMSDYGVPRPTTIPKKATEFLGKNVPLRIWTKKVNVAGESYLIQSAFEMDDFYEALDHFALLALHFHSLAAAVRGGRRLLDQHARARPGGPDYANGENDQRAEFVEPAGRTENRR